jgi:hypothetical protein
MGTFKDFLKENTKSPEEVAQSLLDNCMPYINAVGEVEIDTILYRGTNAEITDFMPRERKEAGGVTAGSSDRMQMISEYLKRKCGVNLDTIIFTTSDLAHAKTFGNPFVVFPVGAFKYVYSQTGHPLPNINNEADLEKAKFICGLADDNSDDGIADPRFQHALVAASEILIEAKSYIPISVSFWKANGQRILEELSFR